jgi:hypothetical protein
MKYICFGYLDEKKWKEMSEIEQQKFVDECLAYDEVLRKNGHFAGGEALQGSQNAIALRWKNGKASITDGPFIETKEQIGGIMLLEARDLNHAIQLMSLHPSLRLGPGSWEIRPAADLPVATGASEHPGLLEK